MALFLPYIVGSTTALVVGKKILNYIYEEELPNCTDLNESDESDILDNYFEPQNIDNEDLEIYIKTVEKKEPEEKEPEEKEPEEKEPEKNIKTVDKKVTCKKCSNILSLKCFSKTQLKKKIVSVKFVLN